MIIFFTDFSYKGPYIGQLKSAVYKEAPDIKTIDLMHDAPVFDIKHSALLLNTLRNHFPENGVFCCVVDPGVGSSRQAIVIKVAEQYFVGPDNGLFEYIIRTTANIKSFQIVYTPTDLSKTFHGRDIFAPVSAQVHNNNLKNLQEINPEVLQRFNWPDNLSEIIYIDTFGNLMTGLDADSISKEMIIKYKGYDMCFADTYSEIPAGRFSWYINSNNLAEIAVNSGNAASILSSQIGDFVTIGG